ncbi:MAG: hypothetical protein CFK52_10780 [Chloracidobacterium sp. CP2_5A]|nr:MAG: hypothetical protein CFK52_10780 [Chloracidobacterium sp. CP2_5A]
MVSIFGYGGTNAMMTAARNRSRVLGAALLGLFLLVGAALPVAAQSWDPWGASDPRFNRRPPSEQWVRERGRDIGFQIGFEDGRNDRQRGFRSSFRNATYENAMQGFQREWRHDGNYRRGFRDGYRAGYEQGYNDLRGRRGRGRGRDNDCRPDWRGNRDWGWQQGRGNGRFD